MTEYSKNLLRQAMRDLAFARTALSDFNFMLAQQGMSEAYYNLQKLATDEKINTIE